MQSHAGKQSYKNAFSFSFFFPFSCLSQRPSFGLPCHQESLSLFPSASGKPRHSTPFNASPFHIESILRFPISYAREASFLFFFFLFSSVGSGHESEAMKLIGLSKYRFLLFVHIHSLRSWSFSSTPPFLCLTVPPGGPFSPRQ